MQHSADKNLEKVIQANGFNSEGKVTNDPRIEPKRKWMREYFFLDELPQLFYNVLYKRNMKLVGIRPRSENHWKHYPKEHKQRCTAEKPGLIGIHKISNGKTQLQKERRYMAEQKVYSKCLFGKNYVDLKWGLPITYGIIMGKIKGI